MDILIEQAEYLLHLSCIRHIIFRLISQRSPEFSDASTFHIIPLHQNPNPFFKMYPSTVELIVGDLHSLPYLVYPFAMILWHSFGPCVFVPFEFFSKEEYELSKLCTFL